MQVPALATSNGIGLLDVKRMARALRKLDIIAAAPRGP
jgi:hypothetical protein